MFYWKSKIKSMRDFLASVETKQRLNDYSNEKHFFLRCGLMERQEIGYVLTEKGIRFRDKFLELYSIVFKSESDGRDDILEATERERQETPR